MTSGRTSPEEDDEDGEVLPDVIMSGGDQAGFGDGCEGRSGVEGEGEECAHEAGQDGDGEALAEGEGLLSGLDGSVGADLLLLGVSGGAVDGYRSEERRVAKKCR